MEVLSQSMQIRSATSEDIQAIVVLLRASLGESLLPKSEAFWNWKHNANPFGASPVLLAEEDGQLIGVRAFLNWHWAEQGQPYRAVRAVDTATHPQHQGKGIFKKLTLQMLDSCQTEGVDFVFNTPNGQSLPGYLKMGWQEAGRLPVGVVPVGLGWQKSERAVPNPEKLREAIAYFCRQVPLEEYGARIATKRSEAYLQWRYTQIPILNYSYALFEQNGHLSLLVYRIKRNKGLHELRITEYLSSARGYKPLPQQWLHDLAKAEGANFYTFAATWQQNHLKGLRLQQGPVVTVRRLASASVLSRLLNFKDWEVSLGDLELF